MLSNRRDFLMTAAAVGAAAGRPAPADSGKRVRLAVVGGGFGATFQWHKHPQCTVTAVTDLYPARRERLRKAYRCDNVYDTLEDMLQRERNIDAVAVFSGAPDHYRHVDMCMRRGLHVVSACPAVMALEDAHKLKELKERTGLRYMMAESSYYRMATIHARKLYREGSFGEMLYSEVEYYHDVNVTGWLNDKKSLYYNPDGSISWRQGLPPMLYPTHSVGFLTAVTGERITKVSCLGFGRGLGEHFPHRPYKGNPFMNEASLMQTNKGHMVRCNVFWQIPADGEVARWYGEKGSLYMKIDDLHPDMWCDRGSDPKPIMLPEYWNTDMLPPAMRGNSGHGGSAAFISAEFINALLEDREPAIDVYESLAMNVPGIIAHQSALRQGEQLPVPQLERPRA
jgi:predicted dehydrogenase